MAIPRNKYVEIREDKPGTPEKAKWPEFKTCNYTTEAIVSDGIDKGELRKVCTEPTCPVHHPKKQTPKADASLKAEHEKRHEEALANATGNRVLKIEFAGEFLPKHRFGNPGGFSELFVQISRGLYRLK
jgi:ParB family transcriptional regulator, chromosome partitioning protein